MPLRYIDLFAGCGGLSLGLYNAGCRGIFAVEKSKDAFLTLNKNLITTVHHFQWPEWLPKKNHDIYDLIKNYKDNLIQLRGSVDLLVGGPPCQGFSLAGKRNANDLRNRLFGAYMQFVRLVCPDTLVFENVHGFTVPFQHNESDKQYAYSDRIRRALQQEGYSVESRLIDVSQYGVPQKRTRFILIASKVINPDRAFQLLEQNRGRFLIEKNIPQTISVRDAIGDLCKSHGQTECPDFPGFYSGIYGPITSRYQQLMRQVQNGMVPNSHRFSKHRDDTIAMFNKLMLDSDQPKRYTPSNFPDLKKRGVTVLKGDYVCSTVTSIPDDFVHYCEPRIPTVRELARIQSFPDWYEFCGKYTTGGDRRKLEVPRYTQVANAVPPLFAEQIGRVLEELINNA